MAIQPIDLQALFAQSGNVGKTQAAIRDGQQMQSTLQQAEAQKKLEANVRTVNEAQEMGKDTSTIKDQGGGGGQAYQGGYKKKQQPEDAPEKEAPALIRDSALGRNIDLSG
ncbi:MAG: hypothetical protein FWD91_02290 [Treponema sp.]|nr:hypothetical protein [Treponema sp.]